MSLKPLPKPALSMPVESDIGRRTEGSLRG